MLQDGEWPAVALAPLGARTLGALPHGDEGLHLNSQLTNREMYMCFLELLHLGAGQLCPVVL
eukprot:11489486-Heterocapsa_arctica.AAC.1